MAASRTMAKATTDNPSVAVLEIMIPETSQSSQLLLNGTEIGRVAPGYECVVIRAVASSADGKTHALDVAYLNLTSPKPVSRSSAAKKSAPAKRPSR